MKKVFVYTSMIGFTIGIVYWICKNKKLNKDTSKTIDNKLNFKPKLQDEEEIYQVKNESVKAVNERHLEAGKIMKDAYNNIMEDFIKDFSNDVIENTMNESKEDITISESVLVTKELDSILDEFHNSSK